MKKLIAVAVVAMMILGTSVSANEWNKIRVGVEGAYPPFSWVEKDGTLKDMIKFQLAHKPSRIGGPTFWTLFTHFFHEKVPSLCRRKTHNYDKSGSRPLPCRECLVYL